MIEQINIALEQGVRFLNWVIEACRRNPTSERERHQLKVMKNEHPAFFLEQDDIVNSLNYEGIAVIELRGFTTFLTVRDACWLCHRLNKLND